MASDPRKTRRYQTLRANYLATHDLTCHWCGTTVYTTLPNAHPLKATIDHTIEVDRAPALAYDTELWVIACWTCNASRGATHGNTKHHTPNRKNSRQW